MPDFYKVILGAGHDQLNVAVSEGWVGVGWLESVDLTNLFPETIQEFREGFSSTLMDHDNLESKVAAGNAISALFAIGKQMREGDFVISPTPRRTYRLARIHGPYSYAGGQPLPHRRPAEWLDIEIPKDGLTTDLQRTLSSPRTLSQLKGYPDAIQQSYEEQLYEFIQELPAGHGPAIQIADGVSFVMEKYLEDFLVNNWDKTVLAEDWDFVDSQVDTTTGPLDILAKSKDGKTFLVIELKLRRASDNALGQVQRYMGWVNAELELDKRVEGLIIGDHLDNKLRYALSVATNVSFMRYNLDFTLSKESALGEVEGDRS